MRGGIFLIFADPFWQSWMNPWLVISFFFPICQILYLSSREKKIWGEKIYPPTPWIFKICFLGLISGFFLSVFLSPMIFSFTMEEVLLVWLVVALFAMGGFRYLCISYAIGFLSLTQMILDQIVFQIHPNGWIHWIYRFSTYDWLWIVAFIHFIEWLFIRLDGDRGRKLITTTHQSGNSVNGFVFNRIWPLPCVIFTPMGWLPVPLMVGFSSYNLSKPIEQQKRFSSTLTLFYILLLCSALWLAKFWDGGLWIAVFLVLFGHELIFRWQQWREKRAYPLFTSDELGLKILEVLPSSPAAHLGIRPGDILQRINGVSIYTIEDVEKVTASAAHCKLELLDQQHDHHFVQKVIYEDDPKHLGIIGAVSLAETAAAKEEDS